MEDLFGEDKLMSLKSERGQRKRKHRRQTELVDIEVEEEYRRCFGVQNLLKVMGLERPRRGHSYHIISGGNVDLIAHVRWLLLHYTVEDMFLSCWAISVTDILLLKRWHEERKVAHISIIVGDIYPSNYSKEWRKLCEMYDDGMIERLHTSAIHSKLILLKTTEGCVVVESSANCNMNPRIEQSVVTLNDDLYRFYLDYFDELFTSEMYRNTNKELVKMSLYEQSDNTEGA